MRKVACPLFLLRKDVNIMKKVLSIMFLCLILCTGTVYAAESFWVGSVWNDQLGAFVPNIQNLDWSSSGSGNAQGMGPAGTAPVVGTNFNFRYQSFLAAVIGPTGDIVAFPGLNTNFEYTIVVFVPEVVNSVTTLPGGSFLSTFKTLSGGTFLIYHDASPNANVATGFGFDDGTLVASGTINTDQISSFAYTPSNGQGIGSAIMTGVVTYANPTFLNPATAIIDFRFESNLNYSAFNLTSSAYFNGRAGEGNFPAYTVANNDLAFEMDGSSKFSEKLCIGINK